MKDISAEIPAHDSNAKTAAGFVGHDVAAVPTATRYSLAYAGAFALLPAMVLLAAPHFSATNARLDTICWVASTALAALLLRWLTPRTAHLTLALVVLAWLLLGVGLAQAGATALFLGSAWALGRQMLRWMRAATGVVASILTGTALWLMLWGVLIHFPVNERGLYIALCCAPFLWLAGETGTWREQWRAALTDANGWMRTIPFWAWALGLILIGWYLHWAWLPSTNFDDYALHLRFWTELVWQRRVTFDVQTQVWSVAPFARDLLHAGLSLMAGDNARGACNLALALATLLLLVRMMHAWGVKPVHTWLLLVLFASTPMFGQLLLTQQTELFLATLALAGASWLGDDYDSNWRAHLPAVLASAALCAATKLPGAVLGAALLATLALRAWGQRGTAHASRSQVCWPAWGVFLLGLGFVALHSYVVAWAVTGNPLFPLYNGIFRSPYAPPRNYVDMGFVHGFSVQNYIRMFFETSKFFEGKNFTAGWQYLFLLPPAALVLLRRGIPGGLRLLAVPTLSFGFVMFAAVQHLRYLFPVVPLASGIMAALLIGGGAQKKNVEHVVVVLCLACITLNTALFTGITNVMRAPPVLGWSMQGREKILQAWVNIIFLTSRVNTLAPGARVLFTPGTRPYGATLFGTPLYIGRYAPARTNRFNAIKRPADVAKFLEHEKVDFIIMPLATRVVTPADRSKKFSRGVLASVPEDLLRQHMTQYGDALAQLGPLMLYRVREIPVQAGDSSMFSLQAQGLAPQTVKGAELRRGKAVATFPSRKARHALYRATFSCPADAGFFSAQINWDNGERYQHTLACKAQRTEFAEAIPVPFGATRGTVVVRGWDTPWVQIEEIAVDLR